MSCKHPTGDRRQPPTSPAAAAGDTSTEAAVLDFVLREHPDHLTPAELSLAVNRGKGGFAAEDAVDRALEELIGAGLCCLAGSLVVPTRPAICFERLRALL